MEFKKADNTIRYFDELFIGNMFIYKENGNDIYMKIEPSDNDAKDNAVNLTIGTLHIFSPKAKVIKVDGTLSYHEV